jgi:hypothetical protein
MLTIHHLMDKSQDDAIVDPHIKADVSPTD